MVDSLLYETDKHVQDNIQLLCMFFAMHGVMAEEIEHIYVLGHSMSAPDLEYFAFLARATGAILQGEAEDNGYDESRDVDPMDDLFSRLEYAIRHVGYGMRDGEIDDAYREAVMRRFHMEQAQRDSMLEKDFLKALRKGAKRSDGIHDEPTPVRERQATWHISYYGEENLKRYESVMNKLGCESVYYFPTIDECLEDYAAETST